MSEDYFIICLDEIGRGGFALFWKPKALGYTCDFDKAGRFTKENAKEVNKNGRDIALTLNELKELPSTKVYKIVECSLHELKEKKLEKELKP